MFYSNFVFLCDSHGISKSSMCKRLGMSENAWQRWADGSEPRKSTVDAISVFFNVPVFDLRHKDLEKENAKTSSVDARQELFEQTELKVLFDAAKDVPAYKLYEVAAQLMKWKEDNGISD